MRTFRHLALVLLSLIAAVPSANAQELIDRRNRKEYRIEPSGVSLDQAVKMAERRYRAKAFQFQTIQEGDRRIHEIRVLESNGKARIVRVDAESGAMN